MEKPALLNEKVGCGACVLMMDRGCSKFIAEADRSDGGGPITSSLIIAAER